MQTATLEALGAFRQNRMVQYVRFSSVMQLLCLFSSPYLFCGGAALVFCSALSSSAASVFGEERVRRLCHLFYLLQCWCVVFVSQTCLGLRLCEVYGGCCHFHAIAAGLGNY